MTEGAYDQGYRAGMASEQLQQVWKVIDIMLAERGLSITEELMHYRRETTHQVYVTKEYEEWRGDASLRNIPDAEPPMPRYRYISVADLLRWLVFDYDKNKAEYK